jgi:membrane protein YqaA with SNARE-associated domain
MELVAFLWDLLVHLDKHLAALLQQYGAWIYALLFVIVFCETGLVVTPFLPGDSLLFVAGALWAAAGMDARLLAATLIVAALCGDNVNYWTGRFLGPQVFRWEGSRLFNPRRSRRRMLTTSALAAARSSSPGSSRWCARSRRSWREWGRCPIRDSSRSASPARSPG